MHRGDKVAASIQGVQATLQRKMARDNVGHLLESRPDGSELPKVPAVLVVMVFQELCLHQSCGVFELFGLGGGFEKEGKRLHIDPRTQERNGLQNRSCFFGGRQTVEGVL